jgi:hypothetical protein
MQLQPHKDLSDGSTQLRRTTVSAAISIYMLCQLEELGPCIPQPTNCDTQQDGKDGVEARTLYAKGKDLRQLIRHPSPPATLQG